MHTDAMQTYIHTNIHMLRQLTKPLITDCRYSTLAALNEICRQSRREWKEVRGNGSVCRANDLKDAQRRVVALSEAENRNGGHCINT